MEENKKREVDVSVCIVCFNQEQYIEQCIMSTLNQKVSFKYEIVIGDDCSTDGTLEICRRIQQKYPEQVRLIARKSNLGISGNFIDTIRECKGKYIAFCEGDDYWTSSEKLQLQFDGLESFRNINLCFHQMDILDEESETITTKEYNKYRSYQIVDLNDVLRGNGGLIQMPSIFMRKDNLLKYLHLSSGYKAVHFFLQIVGSLNGVLFIARPMAVYRKNSSTSVIKNQKNSPGFYDQWTQDYIQKLEVYRKIVPQNYLSLIDELGLKEKKTAIFSFRTSRSYRKKLINDVSVQKFSIKEKILFFSIYKFSFSRHIGKYFWDVLKKIIKK